MFLLASCEQRRGKNASSVGLNFAEYVYEKTCFFKNVHSGKFRFLLIASYLDFLQLWENKRASR
jgi:hypothetical protein